MRTPVSDTTEPFNGGTLRVYDVHIAKMVEVTHHQCKKNSRQKFRDVTEEQAIEFPELATSCP